MSLPTSAPGSSRPAPGSFLPAPRRWRTAPAGMPTSGSASSAGDGMPISGSASSAGDAVQLAGTTQDLLQDIRAFGRIPKEVRGSSEAQLQERHLAEKLRKAKYAGLLSAAEEFELAEIKASELDSAA